MPSLCTKIAGEMPAGTLKKVGGSPPTQTGREKVGVGRGGVVGRRGVAVPAVEARDGSRLAPRRDHRED